MKVRVGHPKDAAAITGGCTLEVDIGWWTYVPDQNSNPVSAIGKAFKDHRDALYIPTLQKDGNPVDEQAIAELKSKARELGFTETSSASGMWILTETGLAQVEFIWILWSNHVSVETRAQLPKLAEWIRQYTNQDCVAYEIQGKLKFTGDTKMNIKRIWITPINDGESIEIRNLLHDHDETVVVSRQPWGASWPGLEAEVVSQVEQLLAENPEAHVYGVEFAGQARWNAVNIDHHQYPGDDRRNPKSSLEQVAEVLGVELTHYQKLISENDKGYIPALERFGASPDEILLVRAQDRLAQGVTPDHERQAVIDLKNAEWRGRKVIVRCPKGASSAITDRIYRQYDEAMTIDMVNGKWIYFGKRHHQFYALTEGGVAGARWVGGPDKFGYSGAEKPNPETQQKILAFFWEK